MNGRLLRRGLMALCLMSLPAWGQDAEPRREELFKMVEAYIVSNLQESLALSDEQFVRILPLLRRVQSERRAYVLGRARLLNEMRRLLESGTATDARLAELMRNLKQREVEEPAALRQDVDALDAQLTPVQQAKLRLLETRVEQRLRDLMTRSRPQQGTTRPFRRQLPPEAREPAP